MDYFDWKASYARNPATPKAYKVWIDRFNNYINKPTTDITLEDVSRFRVSMKDKYAPSNIQYGMAIIHDYLKFQMAHGLKFPIALFKVKRERANSHYVVTEREYLRILASCRPDTPQGLRNVVMVRVLWETGMRVGELVRVCVRDLVKQGCQIRNEKNTYNRNVFWTKETEEVLRFYLKQRGVTKSPELFLSCGKVSEGGITPRQVERILKILTSSNRMNRRICPHSFRHAFVHRQILRGVSEPVVANMVGHHSTNTIMTYSKLSSLELSKAWGATPVK